MRHRATLCTNRRGATILEVLFAIFVVVVGLLGIASIIPLATRNASESNTHNHAQALGLAWIESFFSRGMNESTTNLTELKYNWVWYRDYANAGAGPGWEDFHKAYAGVQSTRIGILPGLNESPSNSVVNNGTTVNRVWGHQAVCIDPFFFTEPDVVQRISTGTTRYGSYRASVFPYFEEGYNPVTDPYLTVAPGPDQPRMIRTSLAYTNTTTPYPHGVPAARKLVEDMFASTDDIASSTFFVDPATGERLRDDEGLPAYRIFSTDGSGTALKAQNDGSYTWMATVVPAEPTLGDVSTANAASTAVETDNDYLVSLLIMHKRDRGYIPAGATPVAGNVDDKPQGERLTWVYPLSGNFTGGNGGRVRLMANAGNGEPRSGVSDELHIGDWIMLGRYYLIDPTGRSYSFFRWYRIIAVDPQSRVGTVASLSPTGVGPFGGAAAQNVWARDVVLEGPDFAFGATPTMGTLMSNVVTIVERRVSVN